MALWYFTGLYELHYGTSGALLAILWHFKGHFKLRYGTMSRLIAPQGLL